jgi:hypothetical protein
LHEKERIVAKTEQYKNGYVCMGRRIRERHKLLKLSQTELAQLMGFS